MIRIENLSKDLGEFFLRDVSLEINDGEYFMVLGPTGAGKTILLETIAGIYRADSGRIFLGVGNLFQGESRVDNDIASIDVDGINIVSATLKPGSVHVSIRPEDILVLIILLLSQ